MQIEPGSKILLLTGQLFQWAGSEIVILELAEEFIRRGALVTVYASYSEPDFCANFQAIGAHFEPNRKAIILNSFDVVYCQHQTITSFLDQLLNIPPAELPLIVYGHLSPFAAIEFPGPHIEGMFGDAFLCNSLETKNKMRDLGLDHTRLKLMQNPAPDAFFDIPINERRLARILVVSNHLPVEVRSSFKLLENDGIKVTFVGLNGTPVRVTPELIAEQDAIISIGKTVQYALAANRPVYVYDHFGGPGWLNESNFSKAAEYNFSGRCCSRKITAEILQNEVRNGFETAVADLDRLSNRIEGFRLSTWFQNFFETIENCQSPRRKAADLFDSEVVSALQREYHMFEQSSQTRAELFRVMHYIRNTPHHRIFRKVAQWLGR